VILIRLGNLRAGKPGGRPAESAADEAFVSVLFAFFLTNALLYKFVFNPSNHHLSSAVPALGMFLAMLTKLIQAKSSANAMSATHATEKLGRRRRMSLPFFAAAARRYIATRMETLAYALCLGLTFVFLAKLPLVTIFVKLDEAGSYRRMQESFKTVTEPLYGGTVRTSASLSDFSEPLRHIAKEFPSGPIPIVSRYDGFVSFALERPILSPYPDISTNLNEYEDIMRIVALYRRTKPKVVAIESKLLQRRYDEVAVSLGEAPGLGRGKGLATTMASTWRVRSRMAFLIAALQQQVLENYRVCREDALFSYYCDADAPGM
jgi:hypothetical protein